jgi:hypothetical protein
LEPKTGRRSRDDYSDTLLIFMLKGRRPEKFRDNARVEMTGEDGGRMSLEAMVISSMSSRDAQVAAKAETAEGTAPRES